MKIKEIYCQKGNYIVSLTIAALCVLATLISVLFPDTYQAMECAYPIQYPWQIFSGIFLHGKPTFPLVATIGHLVFNLLLVLPFGIMIEKILGSKRFAAMSLAAWMVYTIAFFVIAMVETPAGETAYGAGISGIAFSYGMIGAYILFVLGKRNRKLLLKQVSFYALMNIVVAMLVMINPFVAGVSSMIIHLIAVAFGVVYIMIYKKRIHNFFSANE